MFKKQVMATLAVFILNIILAGSLIPINANANTSPKAPPAYDWSYLDIYCYPNTCAVYPGMEYSVYMYVYNNDKIELLAGLC